MDEYETKEKEVMKILVEVATAKREAEIVSKSRNLMLWVFEYLGKGLGNYYLLFVM